MPSKKSNLNENTASYDTILKPERLDFISLKSSKQFGEGKKIQHRCLISKWEERLLKLRLLRVSFKAQAKKERREFRLQVQLHISIWSLLRFTTQGVSVPYTRALSAQEEGVWYRAQAENLSQVRAPLNETPPTALT